MPEQEEVFADAQGGEPQGDQRAHRRPHGPAGVLLQFGAADAGALDHEAAEQHGDEPHQHDEVFTAVVQAVGSPHVTAPGETGDADQTQQAEQVQGEGIEEVEGAVQEFDAKVFLHRYHEGADEQHHEADVHAEMQHPRPFAQRLLLTEAVDQHFLAAAPHVVQAVFRAPLHPQAAASVKRPAENSEGHRHEGVDPLAANDVAVNLACRHHGITSQRTAA